MTLGASRLTSMVTIERVERPSVLALDALLQLRVDVERHLRVAGRSSEFATTLTYARA
jgi:hypothetical protein